MEKYYSKFDVIMVFLASATYMTVYFYIEGYSLGLIISIIASILLLIQHFSNLFTDKNLFFLWLNFVIFTLVFFMTFWINLGDPIEITKSIILGIIYSIAIIIASNLYPSKRSLSIAKTIIRIFIIINSVYSIFQFYFLKNFGFYPLLPWQVQYAKISGFFGEPAHMAIFYLLIVFLKIKIYFFELFLHLLALFLSSSLTSIYVLLLFAVKYIKLFYNSNHLRKNIKLIYIFVIVLFIFFNWETFENFYNYYSMRVQNFLTTPEKELSGFQRFLSSLYIYPTLPIKEKIFGTGPGNSIWAIKNYSSHNYYTLIDRWGGFSPFFYELTSYGIIISTLLNFIYYKITVKKLAVNDFIYIQVLRLWSGFSINYSAIFVFILILYFSEPHNNKLSK